MRHVCTANDSGICAALDCPALTGLNLRPPVAGAPVRGAVAALRGFRAYRAQHVETAREAVRLGLVSLLKPLARIAFAPSEGAKLAAYAREVAKAQAGEAKRAEQAEAAQARRCAAQAKRIALRASMAAEWLVVVMFRRGAHDVRVVRVGETPKGYAEARVSVKVRGDAPGLLYREAERVAEGLARKLAGNAPAKMAKRRRA